MVPAVTVRVRVELKKPDEEGDGVVFPAVTVTVTVVVNPADGWITVDVAMVVAVAVAVGTSCVSNTAGGATSQSPAALGSGSTSWTPNRPGRGMLKTPCSPVLLVLQFVNPSIFAKNIEGNSSTNASSPSSASTKIGEHVI